MLIEHKNGSTYLKTYSLVLSYIQKLISIYKDKLSSNEVNTLKYTVSNKGFLKNSIFEYNDLLLFNKEDFITFLFLDILPESYIYKEIIDNFSYEHKFIFMLLYYIKIDKRNVFINTNEDFLFLKKITKKYNIKGKHIIFSNGIKESIDTKLFFYENQNRLFNYDEKLDYAKNNLNTRFIDKKDVLLFKKHFNFNIESIRYLLR